MVRAIVATVQPERIILFGSLARGDEQADSDVDLLIIEAEPFGPSRSRFHEIAAWNVPWAPFPWPLIFWSIPPSANHVVARALREEKVLHARP